MKQKYIEKTFSYDGTQLHSLFAYLNYQVLGDSIVSWQGACDISPNNMVDGEDLLLGAKICGRHMLHFIVEKFNVNLFSGVAVQRLIASLAIDVLQELSPNKDRTSLLLRDGDDIYIGEQKLSISIATNSPTSTLIHFAVNVTNEGTPVETLCLQELKVDPIEYAKLLMMRICDEIENIEIATQKVKWVN